MVNWKGIIIGIDCVAEIVQHEKKHNIFASYIIDGMPDRDPTQYGMNHIGDTLPDSFENSYSCHLNDKDTHNLRTIKHRGYAAYGDGEYAVMIDSRGARGNIHADWSFGGRQW